MVLIWILAAFAIERFSQCGDVLSRFSWFDHYIGLMRNFFEKSGLWKGVPGLILVLAPILIAVFLIHYFFASMLYGLVGFVLAIVILVYCLGPQDLYNQLEGYFTAEKGEDGDATKKSLATLLTTIPEDEQGISRAVTKTILTQFNQRIFAVLFWFVLLGPVGAVFYRIVAETKRSVEKGGSSETSISSCAAYLLEILDWAPIRLAGLAYTLVGDFHHGFSYWIKHVISGFDKNGEFAQQSGLIALHLNDDNAAQANVDENRAALALTDRTIIIYLVVIAVFVLGAVIY